jgi:hypothetical protein
MPVNLIHLDLLAYRCFSFSSLSLESLFVESLPKWVVLEEEVVTMTDICGTRVVTHVSTTKLFNDRACLTDEEENTGDQVRGGHGRSTEAKTDRQW